MPAAHRRVVLHTLGRVKDAGRRRDESPSSSTRLRAEDGVIARSDCVIASTPYEFDDLIDHYKIYIDVGPLYSE